MAKGIHDVPRCSSAIALAMLEILQRCLVDPQISMEQDEELGIGLKG